MTDEAPRGRSADRADDVETSRKARYEATTTDPSLRRFGITEKILDLDKFTYRSVADDGKTRLLDLTTKDDYDFVLSDGSETPNAEAKGVLRYRHGSNLDGSPQYTYLLRKPKKFADEHRAQALAKTDAYEKAILTGKANPEGAPDKSYTPGQI